MRAYDKAARMSRMGEDNVFFFFGLGMATGLALLWLLVRTIKLRL
jgi:hypothetical protein